MNFHYKINDINHFDMFKQHFHCRSGEESSQGVLTNSCPVLCFIKLPPQAWLYATALSFGLFVCLSPDTLMAGAYRAGLLGRTSLLHYGIY